MRLEKESYDYLPLLRMDELESNFPLETSSFTLKIFLGFVCNPFVTPSTNKPSLQHQKRRRRPPVCTVAVFQQTPHLLNPQSSGKDLCRAVVAASDDRWSNHG
ncbi:hypothetical protein ElyMa_002867100 [Elysia marginata]|uniref:Uncharacterized protein n=1 Tax=Elysia marginata TaxID=1093978 RepID=A0AAV4HYM9_9GAST|nr:hypothetical protein ElyMa_002867100 [Elysia marginata]